MTGSSVKKAVESSLSEAICMELGIMPLALKGDKIQIGAMNPSFPKLIRYVNEFEQTYELEA